MHSNPCAGHICVQFNIRCLTFNYLLNKVDFEQITHAPWDGEDVGLSSRLIDKEFHYKIGLLFCTIGHTVIVVDSIVTEWIG